MRCSRASRALHLYLDNRLGEHEVAELQWHLTECASCRVELASLRRVQESFNAPELVAEPAGLHDRITRRVATFEARRVLAANQNRNAGVRRVAVAALLLAIMWTLSQLTVAQPFTHWLINEADGAMALLLAPGPAQVAWALWLFGVLMVASIIWISRAHSTEMLREDLLRRLPQLPQLW